MSLMKALIDKSCQQTMGDGFFDSVGHLNFAGYPKRFLEEVAETFVSKYKERNGEETAA